MNVGEDQMAIAVVVDTNIVRAASNVSVAGYAKICAEILEEIARGDFILAMSPELKREWLSSRGDAEGWNKYISQYAFVWWTELQSRQRVRMYRLDANQGEKILSGFSDRNIRDKVQKDLHIVLTALSADKRLISENKRERYHFQRACQWAPFLGQILWPYPIDKVPTWLSQGAPENLEHFLCNMQT